MFQENGCRINTTEPNQMILVSCLFKSSVPLGGGGGGGDSRYIMFLRGSLPRAYKSHYFIFVGTFGGPAPPPTPFTKNCATVLTKVHHVGRPGCKPETVLLKAGNYMRYRKSWYT